ncbi:MAG: hypothetical protein KKB82_03275 [Candidatus Omnitrophica bacterium]|nr:hypothetical protein [Candidatus Omnitrophota bacterium]MBU1924927.1 hypothetical protein [Candidatus Omnitrophota bacterium]
MKNTIIIVNETPYCIWEVDLKNRNLEYINSINPAYFEYLLKTHFEKADEKDKMLASIALRNGYFHGLETLLSLIGAFLQAPKCVYAWISKCSTGELRKLVKRINCSDPTIVTNLNIKKISWESIGDIVFRYYLPNTDKQEKTKKLFAGFWQRLAYEFLDLNNINEYNSIKHGLRIKPGGFGLQAGIEHKPGVPVPLNEMKTVGYSEYGSSFFALEKVGSSEKNNQSLRSRKISVNWRIEKIALSLQLIAISIDNISSILKIINGVEASKVRFHRPVNDSDFEKPWSYSPGVTNMSMDFVIEDAWCKPTTKKELLNILNKQKR